MARHQIYLREEIEKELENYAKRAGITTKQLVRARLESLSAEVQIDGLKEDIRRCQSVLAAMLQMIEIMLPEAAFSAGVLRASFDRNHDAFVSGTADARRLKEAADRIVKGLMDASRKVPT